MITLDAEDAPLVVGDDYDVRRTVINLAEDEEIFSAILTIRPSLFDDAVIVKAIDQTEVEGTGAVHAPDSAADSWTLLFQLTSTDTTGLSGFEEYVYDIEVTLNTGKKFTRESGRLFPRPEVTRE